MLKEITTERAVFATKIGAVATTVGSAVGLGNIWRFPYEAGVHGGGAFMICYLSFVFILGVPLLIAEFVMGRGTRANVFGAYRKLRPASHWNLFGILGIIASLLIISFYAVVAGWTAEFCLASLSGQLEFASEEARHEGFMTFTSGSNSVVWTLIFLAFNFMILIGGVTKGIERASNILMPIFFLLLLAFCINSFFMPGFGEGMKYLFYPDFSKISPSVILGALGQAFFSLSLGLGCMMTYASYFSDKNRLGKTAVTTAFLDTLVAILAGIIIFPAVFSFNLSPEAGPTLVFEVLPHIFYQLPGGMIWSTLFFLLLFLASLTSTVSMSEISISYFSEEKGMSRSRATALSAFISLVGALLCAFSFGFLSEVTFFGKNFFNLFDYLSSNIALPLGGMGCSIFVGWFVKRKFIKDQLTDFGTFKFRLLNILIFFLRWFCPAAIFLIFLNSLGIL
ncbi:MAG: sodium-dependent transporter [Muribaculaceae bacterium]|nr:sodium-dependent transporter [Muribaculaceae bacterium]